MGRMYGGWAKMDGDGWSFTSWESEIHIPLPSPPPLFEPSGLSLVGWGTGEEKMTRGVS